MTRGKFAIVDDVDYDELSKHKWHCTGPGYAARMVSLNGKRKMLFMHGEILRPREGLRTDHINGDKLDNRRSNLRPCTTAQNGRNRKPKYNSTSGYKGVSWMKNNKKWQVHIVVDRKTHFLGLFQDPEEAAKAYNDAARKYHGEFARLNPV